MAKLKDTIVPDFDYSSAAADKLIRKWKKHKKRTPPSNALRPGNVVYINYEAQVAKAWDENPVLVILRSDKKYTFGFNINWLYKKQRQSLIRYFIKYKYVENGRLQNLSIFKGMQKYKFPRKAYRLYFTRVIKKNKIYLLEPRDFFDAITRKLIKKIKIK